MQLRKHVESVIHFFLHYPLYGNERCTLISNLAKIDKKLLNSMDSPLTQALLFSNSSFNTSGNTKVITSKVDYVISTKRFYVPLL